MGAKRIQILDKSFSSEKEIYDEIVLLEKSIRKKTLLANDSEWITTEAIKHGKSFDQVCIEIDRKITECKTYVEEYKKFLKIDSNIIVCPYCNQKIRIKNFKKKSLLICSRCSCQLVLAKGNFQKISVTMSDPVWFKCKTCGFIAFGTDPEEAKNKECLSCGNIMGSNPASEIDRIPDKKSLLIECENCNHHFSRRAASCPKCGFEKKDKCVICETSIPVTSTVCPNCGDPDPFNNDHVSDKPQSSAQTEDFINLNPKKYQPELPSVKVESIEMVTPEDDNFFSDNNQLQDSEGLPTKKFSFSWWWNIIILILVLFFSSMFINGRRKIIGLIIGSAITLIIGCAIAAFLIALILQWATQKVAKFKPSYGMAYKNAFLGSGGVILLRFMLGFAFGMADAGQTEYVGLILLSMIVGFLLQGAIYGQLIKDESSISVGLGKGFAIAGIQLAIQVVIFALIIGAVFVTAS